MFCERGARGIQEAREVRIRAGSAASKRKKKESSLSLPPFFPVQEGAVHHTVAWHAEPTGNRLRRHRRRRRPPVPLRTRIVRESKSARDRHAISAAFKIPLSLPFRRTLFGKTPEPRFAIGNADDSQDRLRASAAPAGSERHAAGPAVVPLARRLKPSRRRSSEGNGRCFFPRYLS